MLRASFSPPRHSLLAHLRWLAIATVLTLFAALVGLRVQADGVALFWPAAGVSVGLMLTSGASRRAAGVGILIALAIGNMSQGRSIGTSLVFMTANLVEAILVASVLQRMAVAQRARLDSVRDVLVFLAAALVIPPLIGVPAAAGLLVAGHVQLSFAEAWWIFTSSHAVGIVVAAPAVLLLLDESRHRVLDHAADAVLVAAVTTVAFVVIGGVVPETSVTMLVAVLVLAPLVWWVALSADSSRAAVSLLIVATVTVWTAASGGLFAGADLAGQLFLLGTGAALLLLGTVHRVRDDSNRSSTTAASSMSDERALVVLVPLMLFAAFGWWSWRGTIADATATVARQAEMLAEHAERVLEGQNAILKAALARVRNRPPDAISNDRDIAAFLQDLSDTSETVKSVSIVDSRTGDFLATSLSTAAPPANLSDREYIAAHRDGKALLHIGSVIRSRVGGRIGFTVSRLDPESGLIAVSLMDREPFRSVYARLPEGARDNALLARNDGSLLVRLRDVDDPVGFRLPPHGLFYKFLSGEISNGSIHRSAVDGVSRLVYQVGVPNFPVQVGYGVEFSWIRAMWLAKLVPFGLLALLSSGALFWLTSRLQRTAAEAASARAEARQELRYRTLVNAAGAMTWTCPPSGQHIEPQPEWMAFTGQTAQQMLGVGWSDAIHPDDVEAAKSGWQTALSRGEPFVGEHRIRRHDGEWRCMSVHAVPFRDPTGNIVEWFGMHTDLTEIKRAEERLLNRNRQLDLVGRNSRRLLLDRGPNDDLLASIFSEIAAHLGVESYYHFRPVEPRLLGLALSAGTTEEERRIFATMKYGELLCGRVAETEQRLVVEDLQHCSQQGAEALSACGATSYAGFPLVAGGTLIGTVAFVSRERTHFSDGDIQSVQLICDQVAITLERRRLQRELRESEEMLRQAMAAADAGSWKIDLTTKAFISSGRALALHGIPPGTAMTHDKALACVYPKDRLAVQTALQKTMETGEPYRLEYRVLRPDGSIRWVASFAERLQDGASPCLAGLVQDISERKQAETALRAAHDSFRNLVERSPFGIFAVDSDFRLAQVSQAAQSIFQSVTPLVGRDFGEVLHAIWPSPYASEAIARFRHTLATGEPYRAEAIFERRTETGFKETYDWRIERLLLPDGRPGVVCNFYDLTERQRQEEHIRFLMNEVSHRSKNMLGLIQAVARQTATRNPEDFVRRFGERIQAIAAAQDLLVAHDWKAVPLVELVQSQLAHFKDLVGDRIAITGPPLSIGPAASQSLGMALHELATNASKYGALSAQSGRIDVTWTISHGHSAEPHLTLSWIETGGPPVAKPTRHGFGSTVTSTMLEMSVGGGVTVDYAPTGLVWTLDCPVANIVEGPPPPFLSDAAKGSDVRRSHGGNASRVLVVEDDHLIAAEIVDVLSDAGFDVIGPAASVRQATELMQGAGCDAAVLDVTLGETETSERIAHSLLGSGTPFVVVTGLSREQLPEVFKTAPLVGKPFHSPALAAELKRCFAMTRH